MDFYAFFCNTNYFIINKQVKRLCFLGPQQARICPYGIGLGFYTLRPGRIKLCAIYEKRVYSHSKKPLFVTNRSPIPISAYKNTNRGRQQ